MINLLILYELNKSPLTMYGISRQIKLQFSSLLKLSMGTLQPALKKLEKNSFISSQKYMSAGGRPSICYAINDKGKQELKRELLSPLTENPVQYLVNARIRLCCSDILNQDDYIALIRLLKHKAEGLMIETKHLEETSSSVTGLVLNNLACEYRNFVSLLEGLEHACKD